MRLFHFLCGSLLLIWFVVRAEEPDDRFVRIYNLIQQADALVEGGQSGRAREKYREAQEDLAGLRKSHPTWNEKVIQFRLNYVAQRLKGLENGTDTPQKVQKSADPLPTADDHVDQIKLLQEQVRQLSADRDILKARLKEALSAQPASVDPRELAKAEETIKALQKEIEVYKVNLSKAETKPDKRIDPPALEEAKKALAGANQRLAQQSEIIAALRLEREALQIRLPSVADGAELKALREQNLRLKDEVHQLHVKLQADSQTSELKQRLAAVQTDFEAQKSRNDALLAEKKILEDGLKELERRRDADFAARTRGLDKELAELKTAAQTNAATISGLQSALRIAREEKAQLEKGNAELEAKLTAARTALIAHQAGNAGGDKSKTPDLEKLRQLERAPDRQRINVAARERYDDKARIELSSAKHSTSQVAVLQARFDGSEARKIASFEDRASWKESEPTPANVETRSGKKPAGELSPGAAALVTEAERAFSARRLEEAEKKYQQALRMDENSVLILANLAAVQVDQNRLAEAEVNLKRALAGDSKDAFSLSLFGILKVRQKKFDEAFDALSRSAQLDPQNPDTFQYLGVTLAEKGLRDPAESAFRRAIQLSPGNADAHYNLAVVYATQQQPAFELARWHYKKAVEAGHPTNPKLENILNGPGAAAAKK